MHEAEENNGSFRIKSTKFHKLKFLILLNARILNVMNKLSNLLFCIPVTKEVLTIS